MKSEQIAKIIYETDKLYNETLGDFSQLPWQVANKLTKEHIIRFVNNVKADTQITPRQLHAIWCDYKKSQGWVYGGVEDNRRKTHPHLTDYDKLSLEKKTKDKLWLAIAKSLLE